MRFSIFNLRFTVFSVFICSFFLSTTEAKAQVTINEFVPDASPEWVEFHNTSPSAEYLKSYYLDDDTDFGNDSGSSAKKILSQLDTSNPSYPFIDVSSFLNNSGDYVVLFSQDGTIIDQYHYASNPGSGISIGRSPDGSGSFFVLASATKGSANSLPPSTPIPTSTPTPSLTSSPTQTPSPTQSPTPPPTPRRTPTNIPVRLVTPVPSPEGTDGLAEAPPSGEVLGLRNQLVTTSPTPLVSAETKSRFPIFPAILILVGLVLIAGSVFGLIKKQKGGYNDVNDNEKET